MNRIVSIVILSVFLITSCDRIKTGKSVQAGFLSHADENNSVQLLPYKPKDYVKWVEDENNGLKAKKNIGVYSFELQYKPLEYVVLREQKNKLTNNDMLLSETEKIKDLQYFTFRIGVPGSNDEAIKNGAANYSEYQKRVNYFSLQMQQDLRLIDGTDTLACVLHHFERTYGVDPYSTFVLAFEKGEKENQSKTFIYNDNVLGVGPVKFTIDSEKFKNIPHLSI